MKDINVYVIDDEDICIDEVISNVNWDKLDIQKKQVYGASSARMARKRIEKKKPGIFICDVEMPGESGLEFIEWVTEWARLSQSPQVTIMLTCHPEYEFIRRAMQLGCLDYVLKPTDMKDLEETIRKAVLRITEMQERHAIWDNLPVAEASDDIVTGKIIPYIMKNLKTSFSIDDIANEVGLNPQYMMRLFKKNTDESILQFVTAKRIELAKEYLLKSDCSIEKITEEIGYFSVAHFNHVFKKSEGISPGQYRKANKK